MSYVSFRRAGVYLLQQSRFLRLGAAAAMLLVAMALPQVAFAGCAQVEATTPYACDNGVLDLGTTTKPLIIHDMNDMMGINFSGMQKQVTVHVPYGYHIFTFANGAQGNIKFIIAAPPAGYDFPTDVNFDFSALSTPIKLDLRTSAVQTVAPGLKIAFQLTKVPKGEFRYAITGTNQSDQLLGSPYNDYLIGLGGNDIINTFNAASSTASMGIIMPGSDGADGGDGNDILTTGNGYDSVWDGNGDDIVNTGANPDGIELGAGNNKVDLGAGDDAASISGFAMLGLSTGTLNGGSGNDMTMTNIFGADCSLFQAKLVSVEQTICPGL